METTRRVAVVTGGASGLGRAVALSLAAERMPVVIGDLKRAAGSHVEPTDTAIRAQGGLGLFVQTDVRERAAVAALFDRAVDEFGRVDVLVSSAGVFPTLEPASELSEDAWRRAVDTNLSGAWFCCQEAGRRFLAQGTHGRIVNISSRLGLSGGAAGRAAYCASKGGLSNLTRQLAVEFGPRGITVNAICPGFIPTDGNPFSDDPDRVAVARARTPHWRLGSAKDIAHAAVFLCSPGAEFINGVNLLVDGGAFVAP